MSISQGVFPLVLFLCCATALAANRTWDTDRNPIMAGADPHAIVLSGRVWMYPTERRGQPGQFSALSSSDLHHWTDHGPILNLEDTPWIREGGYTRYHGWAPALAQKSGKYYLYYSVGPQSPGFPSRIGVAVSKSPAGPFKDSGKPLLIGGNGYEAIDPMVFRDPISDKYYFYAGGSAGSKLRQFEMNPDLVSFKREIPVKTPDRFTEAPFVHYRRGVYYLSYSHGSYRDASYSVHYATSDSPIGPWKYRGIILSSNDTHKGPGHHSFFRHPSRDEWYIVYHRWNNQSGHGPYRGSRQIAIERMFHEPDGTIRPIVMTEDVPPFSASSKSQPVPVSAEKTTSGNPIFPGWYADPEVAVFGKTYWIYPTYSAPYDEQIFLDAFSSRDLVNWTKHPRILDNKAIQWARRAMWAPAIVRKDGRYFLFFAANDIQNDEQMGGIGVAVSDSPSGPFKDYLSKPLVDRFHNAAQPIDQFVFQDKDGAWYMIYGGWRRCNIVRLKDDFTGFVPFPDGTIFREITPEGYVEGPTMFMREGKYYFMWSEGGWTGPNYRVAYAIADSPFGPFLRIGTILQQDPAVATGAGHHSVLNVPGTNDWYIVYHRRPIGETDGNYRETCIDRMFFDEKGLILPVKMTNTGVAKQSVP